MWSGQVCAGDVVASSIWAVPVLLPPAVCSLPLCSQLYNALSVFHIACFFELDIKSVMNGHFMIYLISFALFIILSFIKYSLPFTNMTSCLGTIRSKTKTLIVLRVRNQ